MHLFGLKPKPLQKTVAVRKEEMGSKLHGFLDSFSFKSKNGFKNILPTPA